MIKQLLRFIALLLLFISCSESPPEDCIEEPIYVQLMAEMQLSRAYLQVSKDTVGHVALKRELLKKYQVSEEQFKRSHLWYEKDHDAQLIRYQQARTYIEYLEDGPLKDQSPVLAPQSDSLFNKRFE